MPVPGYAQLPLDAVQANEQRMDMTKREKLDLLERMATMFDALDGDRDLDEAAADWFSDAARALREIIEDVR